MKHPLMKTAQISSPVRWNIRKVLESRIFLDHSSSKKNENLSLFLCEVFSSITFSG